VVLFDRLLDPRMLEGIKAELIDVGKNAGRHKLNQEGINRLLIEKAETGAVVVRLKGGDPYLFGRGGEEALALQEKGIPFEVVPGVTSSIAAPELAGIPVTHRGVASSLTIVTGHEEPGKETPLDWKAIATLGGTLVVLMGVSRLEQNVAALIGAGKSPQTPAAMVEKGGWPEQRMISATLAEKMIVAIGPKTAMALAEQGFSSQVPEEYSSEGMEKMLKGKCGSILFLRSAQGSRYLSEGLKAAGLYVDDIALYEVVPSGDTRLDELIKRARSVDIFAFTSSSTARVLIERARAMGLEKELREALAAGTVAVIGKPTAEELARLGVKVDVMPDKFTFEAMLTILQEKKR
jgi:uroporphyrinogen III methyltransferase/synthase